MPPHYTPNLQKTCSEVEQGPQVAALLHQSSQAGLPGLPAAATSVSIADAAAGDWSEAQRFQLGNQPTSNIAMQHARNPNASTSSSSSSTSGVPASASHAGGITGFDLLKIVANEVSDIDASTEAAGAAAAVTACTAVHTAAAVFLVVCVTAVAASIAAVPAVPVVITTATV